MTGDLCISVFRVREPRLVRAGGLFSLSNISGDRVTHVPRCGFVEESRILFPLLLSPAAV